jgi:3-hydroxyisobutyrate dehydrogenase-like beta-hydroxyacid dehydrogenase
VAEQAGADIRVAVLGLGEAGARIAADLAALGAAVIGWDPDPTRHARDVEVASSLSEAVTPAEIVLSVNSGAAAVDAARASATALDGEKLYADLNTASRSVKEDVAEIVEARGALFADVALLAPVPKRGIRTPALASGSGADEFARLFGALGMPVEVVGREPGVAAERKLIRSVFMKGLAAAIGESLAAAEAAACEEWLHEEIERTLAGADASLVERLVTGSRHHAVRRTEEMEAAAELLRELGVEPRISQASADWLADLARNQERSRT